jgi:uncharacterized protein (DUF924 family)
MFIKLTSVAFKGTSDEHRYTIYLNPNQIEAIHPQKNGCKVFMASEPKLPYDVTEHHLEIIDRLAWLTPE